MIFKLLGKSLFFMCLLSVVVGTVIQAEKIPEKAIKAAQSYWELDLSPCRNDPSWTSDYLGLKGPVDSEAASLGKPYKLYKMSYKDLLKYQKGMDFLSLCTFLRYEFPVIIEGEPVGYIEIANREVEGKETWKGIGFRSRSDFGKFMVSLLNRYSASEDYEVYCVAIDIYNDYALILKKGEYYILPYDIRAAKLILLDANEDGTYPEVPLSDVTPYLKVYAEKIKLEVEERLKREGK